MLNVLSKVVIAFISPLGTALIVGILALLIARTKRRRLASGLSVFAIFWLVLWSLPVASNWLREVVEGQAVDGLVENVASAEAIVVLGGGVTPPTTPNARPNLNAAADRVWYAASLYHAGKAPIVLLSGGGDPQVSPMSEAEAMLLLLSDFGVPESAVLMENKSRNTTQNAQFSGAILKERGLNRILLVTSAMHMKRAMARFQAEDLMVTPAPTDYEVAAIEDWRLWIPDAGALDGSARAMKEIVGRGLGR
jgi:uncharacterized SAM-binding protein YcdF (DUF218 family)